MFGEHIEVHLFLLHFYPSPKVHSKTSALFCLMCVLAINADADSAEFREYRRQIFHKSLSQVLSTLRPGMTTPEVVRCPDNHFRRVVYGIGPYIADYPEQILLSCVVQGWCPW
jgi:hypothetical protein